MSTASIVIVTRNRLAELRTAIRSALAQSVSPEVIVVDDASTDGTPEMVGQEFPGVRLIAHRDSRGYIVRRNEAAASAAGDVIFSIDDDAEFTSRQTVEQTLREFDRPRVGAVAIPYVEPNYGPHISQRAPEADDCWITDTFKGTAHAVRREAFLKLGGYRPGLVHQGEERDFSLRLLAAGCVVRAGRADAIHHYESPKRDHRRMDYYGRRNDILFAWHLVPAVALPVHLAGTTVNAVRSMWTAGRMAAMCRGTLSGYAAGVRAFAERDAVPLEVYRLHRLLKTQSPLPLRDIEHRLPATCCS
jgi:GT2 family glycosyltransferase